MLQSSKTVCECWSRFSELTCEPLCLSAWIWQRVCVCVCVFDRERKIARENGRLNVCSSETLRERVCWCGNACVWVYATACVCVLMRAYACVRVCSPPTFFAPSPIYLFLIPHPQLLIKMSHQIFVASFKSGTKNHSSFPSDDERLKKMNGGELKIFGRF